MGGEAALASASDGGGVGSVGWVNNEPSPWPCAGLAGHMATNTTLTTAPPMPRRSQGERATSSVMHANVPRDKRDSRVFYLS